MFGALVFVVCVTLLIMRGNAIEEARKAYLQSLAALKDRPADADLRERTLALGRAYASRTRNNQGNTLFDEFALMNDINAACAAATTHASRVSGSTILPPVEERLRTLNDLKVKGLIDEGEFTKRRNEILDSI